MRLERSIIRASSRLPRISSTHLMPVVKLVQDLNGGAVLPGDILEYTIVLSNIGNDDAVNLVLTDPIPAGTTYVPGSLQITAGAR